MWIQFFPYPALIGLTILAIFLQMVWWKRRSLFHLVCLIVFRVYLLGIVSMTVIIYN